MEEKVLATIRKYQMIQKGDNVIVALSGGADSVALFHFLYRQQEQLGISLKAAHFEHGLRGEESLRDAKFVEELCGAYRIELFTGQGDMSGRERPAGMGTEAFARELRYAFLVALSKEQDALVATAHTLNDDAETVLFHAIRGAGPRGLAGIVPFRGPIIRPLIDVTRKEIEDYCSAWGFVYMEDSTNRDMGFSRNRLRHRVMPELELAHPSAVRSLHRIATDMRALDEWIYTEASGLLSRAKMKQSESFAGQAEEYDTDIIGFAPPPLRLEALAMLAGPSADRAALGRLEALVQGGSTAVTLPAGLVARRRGQRFWLERPAPVEPVAYQVPLREGSFELPGGFCIEVKISDAQSEERKSVQNLQKDLTFWADYDKITYCGVFRTRHPGDRFSFPARDVTKSVKKWMNEQRIPPALRASLPMLAPTGKCDVCWLWGEGFSRDVQPDGNTKTFLMIRQKNVWPRMCNNSL